MPRARAASVPGRIGSHQSLRGRRLAAVRVDGDDLRPGLRAWCIDRPQVHVGDAGVRAPVDDVTGDGSTASGSMTARVPSVMSQPAAPAVAQMVRSSSDAPRRWKEPPVEAVALQLAPSCRRSCTAESPAARPARRRSRGSAPRWCRSPRPRRCARTCPAPLGPTRFSG